MNFRLFNDLRIINWLEIAIETDFERVVISKQILKMDLFRVSLSYYKQLAIFYCFQA